MKKYIFLILALVSTNAIANDSSVPLPTNIRGVVPEFAVDKENYPKYTVPNKAYNIAILPGDGGTGSYASGIMVETLKNTDYDIIIGTSSGGLATLFSYANDRQAIINFTLGIDSDKILKEKYQIIALLFGDSFAENKPLKTYLAQHITNALIDKMASRYKMHKRGYIVTTNINTAESIFWDIGAIASLDKSYEERRKILIKILAASAALPGIFPPQEFTVSYKGKKYYQTHLDGTVATNELIQNWMLPQNFSNIKDKAVYTIQTVEFIHDFPAVNNTMPNIAMGAMSGSCANTYYLYKTILGYWSTRNNVKSYVNFLPKDSPLNFGTFDFSKNAITTQFKAGRKLVQDKKLQWININK